MKLKDLVGEHGEMELTEAQLKSLGVVVDRFARCEVGKNYYFIDALYDVVHAREDLHGFDDICHAIGNYYPYEHWTEEEVRATAARKKKKAIAENKVNRRIKELNGGWIPNWKYDEIKWYIYRKESITSFAFLAAYTQASDFSTNITYCKTKSLTEQIIEEMHEELKAIWGVE